MENKKKIVLFIVLMLSMIGIVESFMPDTHPFVMKRVCSKPKYASMDVCQNFEACANGNILNDFAVVYYFQNDGARYEITHARSYCRALMAQARSDSERIAAKCSCIHMIEDTVSHNEMVPNSMLLTYLPQTIIHLFTEEKMNDYVRKLDPYIEEEVKKSLLNSGDYIPLIERVLQNDPRWLNVDKVSGEKVSPRTLIQNTVTQIIGSATGFDIGWKNKFWVPKIYYFVVGIAFILFIYMFIKLFWMRKNILGWIVQFGSISIALLLIIMFIGFSLATWGFTLFQTITTPFTAITPTGNLDMYLQHTQTNLERYLDDPSQLDNIIDPNNIRREADGFATFHYTDNYNPKLFGIPMPSPNQVRLVIMIAIILGIVWLGYLHFSKKRIFWSWFEKK